MWNDTPIIVSMTSYPRRISNVAYSIFLILNKQTVRPDDVHLWLAKPEFPNGLSDLPHELQLMIKHHQVELHWTNTNTYCFKRHSIFDFLKNERFYCFMIDDDVQYPANMIESTLTISNLYPKAIINYTDYGQVYYNGYHQGHRFPSYKYPTANNRWCGQSMIPSWVYPMDALQDPYVSLRDKYCPVCDETWLTQFFIKFNIGIFNNSLPWGSELNHHNCNSIGIVKKVGELDQNGLNFRDRCLLNIFKYVFPENKEYYTKYFNYGSR